MTSGIYKITNIVNGNLYIGSAYNIQSRFGVHKSTLNNNKHRNKHLQNAWNKYGEKNFSFKVLVYCKIEQLTKLEQSYMDKLNPAYNICKIAVDSCLGVKRSEETCLKISRKLKGNSNSAGVIVPKERRKRISKALKGHGVSSATRKKISKNLTGKKQSDATIRKRVEKRKVPVRLITSKF
jgi:group I intron endonuclease